MKKYLALAMFVVLAVALVLPISVSAKTKAGVKSGSFFYFFDKAIEKTSLFFTFNPEKKVKKTLEYAEERLAEAEESASENKPEAVKTAMENYQKNIEVLEKVLAKVPEEAKEAITKAIEADKERQEKMTKKIEEINNEIKKEDNEDNDFKKDEEEKSNDDVGDNENNEEEIENKDENKKNEQSKEIEKLKKEVETLKQKQPQIKIIEKVVEKPVIIEKKESSSSQINKQTKQNENIVTLPNGAVVEMDEKGNVVRMIKEASQSTYVAPVPTVQNQIQKTSDTNTASQTTSSSTNITPSSSPKINMSMNSNSAKATPSTSNQIIAKFTIYSQDDKVNSNKSVFKLSISNGIGKTDDLSNFLFVDKNGSIVAGPVNPNNEGVLTFTDTVTFPKGTMEYTLRGTIGSNFSNEQWIYVSADTDNWILKFIEESKPNIQPFQASEMGVFVSSQTNQTDNNGNYVVNINLKSLTDLTSLSVKLVDKETGIEYQQKTQSRNVNSYSIVFTNIPHGNYSLKMIADATMLIGVVQTFTSAVLVQ